MAEATVGKGPQAGPCGGAGLKADEWLGPRAWGGALVWEVGTEAGGAGSWIVGWYCRQVTEVDFTLRAMRDLWRTWTLE